MAFIQRVERWRSHVLDALSRGGYPWPPELVMSLMQRESGGQPGIVNPKNGDSGLLQVIPKTLQFYNRSTGSNVPIEALRDKTQNGVPIQLKVGTWVLGHYWRQAWKWLYRENQTQDIPLDDLARFADACYAAGSDRIRQMARRLPRPVTWAAWETRYPNSKITKHANIIWSNTQAENPSWNLRAVDTWIRGSSSGLDPDPIIQHPVDPTQPDARSGFLLAMAIIIIGYYVLSPKGK